MYKVILFYDVYKKDILKEYGAKNYMFYADYNSTNYDIEKNFNTESKAIDYAQKLNKDYKQYSVSNNDIYLTRIRILNCENEDEPEIIQDFGITLETYDKIK